MIGLAAGLAQRGFRPFCYTIATFALFRPYEFIRCDLAYQNLPVTIVGMGAGLSYPSLGGTHQAVEDVAVATACPNLTVLAPCDPAETAECVRWCASRDSGGPIYLRIGKVGEPDIESVTEHGTVPDKVCWLHIGSIADAETIVISYGPIALEALRVAKLRGFDMITITKLRPLSKRLIEIVTQYESIVVVEEASGAPLAKQLGLMLLDVQIESFALPDEFPHAYGTREELLARAGLTAEAILARL